MTTPTCHIYICLCKWKADEIVLPQEAVRCLFLQMSKGALHIPYRTSSGSAIMYDFTQCVDDP